MEKESAKNSICIESKTDLVFIVLTLFLVARIGFRAIQRVLLSLNGYLGIKQVPSTQTIINWVIRLSISRIYDGPCLSCSQSDKIPFTNGFIYIIDISIALSDAKILPVIGINSRFHEQNKGAPTLRDVHCIAVSTASSWTGEAISEFLKKVITISGRPLAFLKDGGKDLAKAIDLLALEKMPFLCIDDISHIIANILKFTYKNHRYYKTFLSACGEASKNLKQTIIACLTPPKVSTKARFMNLHKLVKWADNVLRLSPKGRARKDSLLSKLRVSIENLPQCKAFIKNFHRDATALLRCQDILKNKGLSYDTIAKCHLELNVIPKNSYVHIQFIEWMNLQLNIAEELGLAGIGMPISSDVIESLFGVAKRRGSGIIKDPNRIALRIPSLCGELTEDDAKRVLDVSVKEQLNVTNCLPSLVKQRRKVMKDPSRLMAIEDNEEREHLCLIPRSKNESKNVINVLISNGYQNDMGPLQTREKMG